MLSCFPSRLIRCKREGVHSNDLFTTVVSEDSQIPNHTSADVPNGDAEPEGDKDEGDSGGEVDEAQEAAKKLRGGRGPSAQISYKSTGTSRPLAAKPTTASSPQSKSIAGGNSSGKAPHTPGPVSKPRGEEKKNKCICM